MSVKPFVIDQFSKGEMLSRIENRSDKYNENWLQELIRLHPEILPAGEFEPVFFPLIPIGREVLTSAGAIDNLFISQQGYPVLVETKLWRNPDARRDVLAQAIDYAASLSSWTFSDLDEETRKYTRKYEDKDCGLIEWIEDYLNERLEDRLSFEGAVSKNLRLGRYLLLIVGDRVHDSVIRMLDFVNRYPHLSINAGVVELQCYHLSSAGTWPLVVVPSILAKTEIVERTIVQVTVKQDGDYEVNAVQEANHENDVIIRNRLTEDEYWDRMVRQAPECVEPAKQIINFFRSKHPVMLRRRENSLAFRFHAPESGQRISLFFISTDGIIECWPPMIASQLEKAGLEKKLLDDYERDLSTLLIGKTKKLAIRYPANQVNVGEFIKIVERFIENVLTAEPN